MQVQFIRKHSVNSVFSPLKVLLGFVRIKKTRNNEELEVVYPNGVILRIGSELSLEMLRSLILLCR